jgi:hypothetical protein
MVRGLLENAGALGVELIEGGPLYTLAPSAGFRDGRRVIFHVDKAVAKEIGHKSEDEAPNGTFLLDGKAGWFAVPVVVAVVVVIGHGLREEGEADHTARSVEKLLAVRAACELRGKEM